MCVILIFVLAAVYLHLACVLTVTVYLYSTVCVCQCDCVTAVKVLYVTTMFDCVCVCTPTCVGWGDCVLTQCFCLRVCVTDLQVMKPGYGDTTAGSSLPSPLCHPLLMLGWPSPHPLWQHLVLSCIHLPFLYLFCALHPHLLFPSSLFFTFLLFFCFPLSSSCLHLFSPPPSLPHFSDKLYPPPLFDLQLSPNTKK